VIDAARRAPVVRWVDSTPRHRATVTRKSRLSQRGTRGSTVTAASQTYRHWMPEVRTIAARSHDGGALCTSTGALQRPTAKVDFRDLGADFFACSRTSLARTVEWCCETRLLASCGPANFQATTRCRAFRHSRRFPTSDGGHHRRPSTSSRHDELTGVAESGLSRPCGLEHPEDAILQRSEAGLRQLPAVDNHSRAMREHRHAHPPYPTRPRSDRGGLRQHESTRQGSFSLRGIETSSVRGRGVRIGLAPPITDDVDGSYST